MSRSHYEYVNVVNIQQFEMYSYIDGLVQDCSISIANGLEILQSCTKPWICGVTQTIPLPTMTCGTRNPFRLMDQVQQWEASNWNHFVLKDCLVYIVDVDR